MSIGPAKLSVLVGEQFACIRICGRANFSSSIDFKTLVNELRARGYTYFVLDLTDCLLMDSTFLGVLAGFGLKMQSTEQQEGASAIELRNANERIIGLLEDLGILNLFRYAQGPCKLQGAPEEIPSPGPKPSKEEVTRACLEAHQTLMSLNPENTAKFKEVTAFLSEDLKKLKNQGS